MAGSKHYLVSFENVKATCGGYDISAFAEIKFTAQANSVPLVTLLVDGGNSNGTGTMAADGISLDNSRVIFDACRSMVKTSSASLSLSMTVRTTGPGGEYTQSLDINGWMLIDVALSPVHKEGVCYASLTFAHPLYKAQLGGSMPGILTVPPMLSAIDGSNPLDVFIASLKAYSEAPRMTMPTIIVPGAASLVDVEPALIRHLTSAVDALKSHLSWRGKNGLPAESVLGADFSALKYAIGEYGTPAAGNSVLHSLLAGLIPECSLALGGDFTAKSLDLGPFMPWADASFEISDSDIVSLDFPQTDPTPISGIHLMVADGRGSGSGTSFHITGSQLTNAAKPVDMFYIPDSEKSAEYMYGPIQQFSPPGWLTQTMKCAAGLRSRAESDSVTASEGSWHSAASIPRDGSSAILGGGSSVAPAMDYERAMLLCAKAYFETSYMKDWAFMATTRLMFSSNGAILCPGRVVSITSNSGEVVGGYINIVEHTVSVANRAAVTRVKCTHPRFGKRPDAITSAENALYA